MTVGRRPLAAKLVLGDRSQNPPQRSLVPTWDLLVVLVALTEEPFKHVHRATPKDLMLKVLFLLATASTRRDSEIHALDALIPLSLFRTQGLTPHPAFLPKTFTEVALSLNLEITAFYPEPASSLERGLWSRVCIFIFNTRHIPVGQTGLCLSIGMTEGSFTL